MNGKGSRPRNNFSQRYRDNYDLIFNKSMDKEAIKKWRQNVMDVVSVDLMRQKQIKGRERYKLFGSDRVLVTHSKDKCQGQHCSIHNHSDHHMKDWPQNWRGDRGIMERICPHGIGHPDPDDPTNDRIHGCDGCCIPPDENARRSHR